LAKNLAELEEKIKNSAKAVIDELGLSHPLNIMEACLMHELANQGLRCIKMNLPFFYKGHRIEGVRFDSTYIVENALMLRISDAFLDEDAVLDGKMRVEADLTECAMNRALIISFFSNDDEELISSVNLHEAGSLN